MATEELKPSQATLQGGTQLRAGSIGLAGATVQAIATTFAKAGAAAAEADVIAGKDVS